MIGTHMPTRMESASQNRDGSVYSPVSRAETSAVPTRSIASQLVATIEGQSRIIDELRSILYRVRGDVKNAEGSASPPAPDTLAYYAEATTEQSNTIATLVGELNSYI